MSLSLSQIALKMPNSKKTFTLCLLCQSRYPDASENCPVMVNRVDQEDLPSLTPFERWKTPEEIGQYYNYSAKHVLRLVKDHDNQIAAQEINGRWFILQCAFEHYLRKND